MLNQTSYKKYSIQKQVQKKDKLLLCLIIMSRWALSPIHDLLKLVKIVFIMIRLSNLTSINLWEEK
jgi:hypothetical protein